MKNTLKDKYSLRGTQGAWLEPQNVMAREFARKNEYLMGLSQFFTPAEEQLSFLKASALLSDSVFFNVLSRIAHSGFPNREIERFEKQPEWQTWAEPKARLTISRASLSKTLNEIKDLLEWTDGWNGYDAAAPNPDAIKHALYWIREMHDDGLTVAKDWLDPHVIADAHGNVVFEWWRGQNKLTIYVSPETVEYVKVWGPNIFSDMEDGYLENSEDRQALWHWLMG